MNDIIYRPWGSYHVLATGEGYCIKLLTVQPGQSLSLQYHRHRQEEWTIISGEGCIQVGTFWHRTYGGLRISILPNVQHRISVPTESHTPLILCEVQLGVLLSEDDIVRLEDQYGRT